LRRRLIFALYRILLTLGFPFLILYILWRGLKDRRYFWRLGERFGSLTLDATWPGGFWLHAVSVGEVMVAATLARELKAKHPDRPVFVSCSTLAGRQLADSRLHGLADGVFYAPFDYPWMIRRVLRRLRPAAVVILETEIWPNLWREAGRYGASLAIVNGRISDKAFPRYRRWRWIFQPVLQLAAPILTQSDRDTERYRELGSANARTLGNLKYDVALPAAPPAEIARWAEGAPLFIAASTMPPDEEEIVIEAYLRMPAGTKMILAPRKPERFDLAADRLRAAGIPFARRSAADLRDQPCLLLDTMGELASTFALDAVVFVGGSIVSWGGHNVLEPAMFGRPIVTGPHMQNFAAMFEEFERGGALRVVTNAAELAATVAELMRNPGDLGIRALRIAAANRGTAARAVDAIAVGAPLTHRPLRWLWWVLSRVWLGGVALDRRFTKPRRLGRPVVSVGGLAMGGSGKTPMVLWLAEQLQARGIRPAILTRGYRRRDRQPAAYEPGENAPVDLTGDEAQLFLKSGTAAVGIGADRYLSGKLLEKKVDLFLLDDGFQHWALRRDLDIVVLDPYDPHAGGGVFPSGWLREGPDALARADFVVTPRKIVRSAPAPGRYSAFCGLGNPSSFRRTLASLGIEVAAWREFPDHHPYRPEDLQGLEPPLITTEKDSVNLPPGAPPVEIVRIGLEVDGGDEILNRISRLLALR
jgi:3-deoxy-D-manno-octulosonic-acid transferase